MKEKLILKFIVTLCILANFCFFFGCYDEPDSRLQLKSLKLNNELEFLYEQVPNYDYGNITLVNGDILRFENENHYCQVYDYLVNQYESWSNIFFSYFKSKSEDQLDSLIDALDFDDRIPLLLFEETYGILDNNLRAVWVDEEQTWLNNGAIGSGPINQMINCPIEQTLYSIYQEICIGDTIYQIRPNSCRLVIPLSEIDYISECRAAATESELQEIVEINPKIEIIKSTDACYEKYYFKKGSQTHPEVGETKFTWSYKYGPNFNGHRYKTSVSMSNYKFKNGKWKRTRAICALGFSSNIKSYWLDNEDCGTWQPLSSEVNNAIKLYSRSKIRYTFHVYTIDDPNYYIQIGGLTFYRQIIKQEFHIDPYESSSIQCRHEGWTYSFNAGTGNLE